jgi:hypothetical protein
VIRWVPFVIALCAVPLVLCAIPLHSGLDGLLGISLMVVSLIVQDRLQFGRWAQHRRDAEANAELLKEAEREVEEFLRGPWFQQCAGSIRDIAAERGPRGD